LLVPIFSK